jgi:hypothetical protein
MVGNSSVYRFKVGQNTYPNLLSNLSKILTRFVAMRHEQAYLSNYLREHHHLEYWDASWCVSFKYQCVQPFPLSFVKPPILPKGAKMVIFMGSEST